MWDPNHLYFFSFFETTRSCPNFLSPEPDGQTYTSAMNCERFSFTLIEVKIITQGLCHNALISVELMVLSMNSET